VETAPAPATGFLPAQLADAKSIAIVGDVSSPLGTALVGLFIRDGYAARLMPVPAGSDGTIDPGSFAQVDVVIYAHALEVPPDDEAAAVATSREAFQIARAVADRFAESGGVFVTLQDTGGDFGLSGNLSRSRAYTGGLAGLAKTAAREWPRAAVRAIDIESGERSAADLAGAIYQELTCGGPQIEVGLRASGERLTVRTVVRDSESTDAETAAGVNQSSVIVAIGGARGVTAHSLIALARKSRPRVALLGRTALAPEATELKGITSDAALKKVLLAEAKSRGEQITPIELNKRAERVRTNREIRHTIEELERAGSAVRYFCVDVQDAPALGAALAEIRAEWGPVTGIVHAAGVLADKFIAQKTDAQFDFVFDTKIKGLRALLDATADDPLELIAFFSSVAARAGNAGQCDYAMANEILNKVAQAEKTRRGCAVKSMNWGPWEGGMVTPELKAHFEAMGVPLLPLAVGAQMFVDEITRGLPGVEAVFGGDPELPGGPADAPREHRLYVDVREDLQPYLADHAVNGVPVVPVVQVIEWMHRAASALYPRYTILDCSQIKVLNGIRVPDFVRGLRLELVVRETRRGAAEIELACELRSAQPANESLSVSTNAASTEAAPRLHYTATLRLAALPGAGGPDHAREWPSFTGARPVGSVSGMTDGIALAGAPWSVETAYADRLFHGPRFAVLQSFTGMSPAGAEAWIERGRTLAAAADGPNGANAHGATDAAMLDGALQLALLWTTHVTGQKNLPTAIESCAIFDPYDRRTGRVRALLRGSQPDEFHTRSDILLVDEDDLAVAELRGVEMHVISYE
jgi:hypothetical protein